MRKILRFIMIFVFGFLVQSLIASNENNEIVKNLLKWNFCTITDADIPDGYKVSFSQENKGSISVINEEGTNVVRLELPEQGKGWFGVDTANTIGLIQGKKYIFTVQIKIEGQKYSGAGDRFFYAALCNTETNKEIYNCLSGAGDTGGWVTSVLFIDTVKTPEIVDCKILLRAYGVAGIYYIKNPSIVEVPGDSEVTKSQIILDNRKSIQGGHVKLEDIIQLGK